MEYTIDSIFPCPVYRTRRDSNLNLIEETEIKDIIEEGMRKNVGNFSSNNTNIFNSKLKNIKEFCEQHIQNYVKEVITPKEELDFYITQSWLNITKPGENHHKHSHMNSIISGVFYVQTVEDDKIFFHDPATNLKDRLLIGREGYNLWNSTAWFFSAQNNILILFPSWMEHNVNPNEKATTDRISISFNTFGKGKFGMQEALSELIIK